MTAEAKIRAAAASDSVLQGFFGTNPFRWFHLQVPPGFVPKATNSTCARVRQVSQGFLYTQEGLNRLNNPRFQIDVLDPNADVVDEATAAIVAWLGTVSFGGISGQHANFVLNVRPGLEVQLKPPIPVQSIDFRIWNLDLI